MDEIKARIQSVVMRVNDYFFDIEPDEPTDYEGAAVFYGSIASMIIVLAVVAIASM